PDFAASFMLCLQVFLQLAERPQLRPLVFAYPAIGDLVDRDGVEIVPLLAPVSLRRDEVGCLEDREMLRHRLPRHVGPLAKLAQGLSVAGTEPVEQAPPRRIGEGLE